ncbi:MAG TPA: dicarboxylate/amino acid:cation symporter [Tepidisphaeraceae bacterium]|jgi:DAACS family dicarboxylate/amino acid:cation (Na+ or H+) symporter
MGIVERYHRTPLYLKILVGMVLGLGVGLVVNETWAARLNVPAKIILQLLGAIAPPLILVAVVRALMTANVKGRMAGRLFYLLALNTLVAIFIGLTVANVLRPGKHGTLNPGTVAETSGDPLTQFLENIPHSLVGPLVDNNVIGVIIIAVAIGLAARRLPKERADAMLGAVDTAFDLIITVLHWIIALVPLAVFGKVVYVVGTDGFRPFVALGWFIVAVLVGLALQGTYYLLRVKFGSWVRPTDLIRGTRDALVMAFSTGSSTATMPVTFECLIKRVGLREESASLGALVGSNFNNDGTALYEAMSALFIAQMLGMDLSLTKQLMVVLTSVVASVGAAGIPEAGLVTMTLVFRAVGLPIGYIALLLPVDWFLDRCRTAVNVMGDMNVSCMLEGRDRHPSALPEALQTADATRA